MAGVYFSYPFCAQKCTYCNFASGVFSRDLERRYMAALTNEISRHQWRWTPETVYIGGGTPSAMDSSDLERVLECVPGFPWREATLEAAPGTLTRERVDAWRRLGIDRVSLGVQSFVRTELARTGRKHDAEMVAADVGMLRSHGIEHCNIDLIAGLPGQTQASFRVSLDWIEQLAPDHVSVYMFEVDEDSRLGRELLSGGVRYGAADVPSDDAIAEMYEMAVERLRAMGIQRYEISNFARTGCESLHNLKYWTLAPYIGFGADGHSFDGALRWQNAETPGEYVRRMESGAGAVVETTKAVPAEERWFVGLRLTQGVRVEEPAPSAVSDILRRLTSDGLLAREGDRVRLTDRGVMVSNEVFQEFLTT